MGQTIILTLLSVILAVLIGIVLVDKVYDAQFVLTLKPNEECSQ